MEVYSSLEKEDLLNNICKIFILKEANINWLDCVNKKDLHCYFYYKNIKVSIIYAKEQYKDIYTFEVNFIDERLSDKSNEIYCDSIPFWFVYSYYENKKYNPLINDELLNYYLNQSKEYIENNKLIFYQTDIKNRRRFIYIEGIKKEIPFGIGDIEKEYRRDFGDKWQNIYNNIPDY